LDQTSEKKLFEQFWAAFTEDEGKHYALQVIDCLFNPRNVGKEDVKAELSEGLQSFNNL
jgi:hypothetical protein